MENWMTVANGVINILITVLSAWLVASPTQWVAFRVLLALVCTGGLANMSGLFWFGYHHVWPGEIVTNASIVLVLGWLVVQPLLRRSRGEYVETEK